MSFLLLSLSPSPGLSPSRSHSLLFPHATGSTSDFNKHGNFLIQWLSRHDPKYPVQRMSSKASLTSHVVALRCLTSLSWTFPLSLCLALQGKLPWLPPSSEACTLLFFLGGGPLLRGVSDRGRFLCFSLSLSLALSLSPLWSSVLWTLASKKLLTKQNM